MLARGRSGQKWPEGCIHGAFISARGRSGQRLKWPEVEVARGRGGQGTKWPEDEVARGRSGQRTHWPGDPLIHTGVRPSGLRSNTGPSGPGRLVSPTGMDVKLVNGPGSGVNARQPAASARPASDIGRSFVQAREEHFYSHTNGWTPASRLRRSASV